MREPVSGKCSEGNEKGFLYLGGMIDCRGLRNGENS